MQPSEAVSSDKTIQFHSSNYYQSKTLYCIYCVLISPFNLRMRNGGSQDSGRKMQPAAAAGSDKGEERH